MAYLVLFNNLSADGMNKFLNRFNLNLAFLTSYLMVTFQIQNSKCVLSLKILYASLFIDYLHGPLNETSLDFNCTVRL